VDANAPKARGILAWLIDHLYGYDVFLSYTRLDDAKSQYSSALFVELTNRRLRCFLDVHELDRHQPLSKAIASKLRASRFLAILAGPATGDRSTVLAEAQLALEIGKGTLLIDRGIDWEKSKSELRRILPDLLPIPERADVGPSTDVINAVCAHVGRWRINVIRRLVIGLAFVVVLMLAVVSALSYQREAQARDKAESNFLLAKQAVDESFTGVEFELKRLPGAEKYRRELLNKARLFYSEFIRSREEPSLDLDYAKAILNLGLIDLELGSEAGPLFEEAASFLERASEKRPYDLELMRHLFLARLNVGVALLDAEEWHRAEAALRNSVALGNRLREGHSLDLALEMDYWLGVNNLATALLSQDRLDEGRRVLGEARGGFEALAKDLGHTADPAGARLRDQVDSYLAGALFNLAKSDPSPSNGIDLAREAWRLFEDILRRDATSNENAFFVGQVCRLMALMLLASGDAGEAEVYGERSFLMNRRLVRLFPNNSNYHKEFEQDIRLLLEHCPTWKQELWFHEAALAVLEDVGEIAYELPEATWETVYRRSIAHLSIAVNCLKPMLLGRVSAVSQEDSVRAKQEFNLADALNEELLKSEAGSKREVCIVMKLNMPMWLELCL